MENNIASVYKITNQINGKVYIGITKRDPEERWYHHQNNAVKGQLNYALYNAIKKYGVENFKLDVLLQSKDELHIKNEMESYFIKEYNSYGSGGYNMTTGGDGVWGLKFNDDSRKIMSDKAKIRSSTPENKERMSYV